MNNTITESVTNTPSKSNNNKSFQVLNKRKINYANIPVQCETAIIRNELYKEANLEFNSTNNFIRNISDKEIEILKDYCLKTPFRILRCDKNVGSILISKENEDILANEILSDSMNYKELESDKTDEIVNQINNEIKILYDNKNIDKKWFNKLTFKENEEYKCGNLKIMPKIHKKEFGVRQIISSIDHPTSKLCAFVDMLINPYIKSIGHILKDSQQLLQEMDNMISQEKLYLYSCDFESLYNKIRPDHAIDLIAMHLHNKTDILRKNKIEITAIRKILHLIFTCNIFKYKNKHFLQLIGIPMGCIAGPVIANIYIYILEIDWLNLNPEIIYYRFIDDIFMAFHTLIDLENFKSIFLYLNLNIEQKDKINFLDLTIEYSQNLQKLQFSLYVKPTNTAGYLLPNSNHPQHIFPNIVHSLVTRIRKICSKDEDFKFHSSNLMMQLVKRNYNWKMIKAKIEQIGKINRTDLLPYKEKDDKKNNMKLFIEYESAQSKLNNCIYKTYDKVSKNFPFLEKKELMIVNNIKFNIGSLFINNFKYKENIKYHFKKCDKINCKICKFSQPFHYFNCNNLTIPFRSNSNCESIGFIYIIYCLKCKHFYIGESGRKVKDRLDEHLKNIINFKKDLNNSLINLDKCSETAIHFNLSGHDIKKDFRFCIFENNVNNKEIRRSIETDLMHLFKNTNNIIINSINKQPSLFNIKYFTFQNDF